MVADIDIKHYYAKFIEQSKSDYEDSKKEYDDLVVVKGKLYRNLNDKLDIINNFFELELSSLDNDEEILVVDYDVIRNKVKTSGFIQSDSSHKVTVLNFIRYVQTTKLIYGKKKQLEVAKIRKMIGITDYKKLVYKFYNYGVAKCILEGNGYKFAGGLGTIVCNRWKVLSDKKVIDFHATNRKKKEIIAAGLKPYDKEEAEIYKLRGMKYDGVDYKVYKNNDYYYEFKLIDNNRYHSVNVKFIRKDRFPKDFSGKSHEEIAKACKSVDDIYKLKADIRCKLMILLHYEPMSYLNFVRNAEQNEHNVGAHNSKNRQRFQS